MTEHLQTATLAGGCFWCLEAVYQEVKGVAQVEPGYAGGDLPSPTYEQVCAGDTGHAEVVQITFDPAVVSYRELLEIFFTIHDPTTLNRQGADIGTQYRSAIFTHTAAQRATADAVIAAFEAQHVWDGKIVTQVSPYEMFYPAEEYHRNYFLRHPDQSYCRAVIAPKVSKLRKVYFEKLKKR